MAIMCTAGTYESFCLTQSLIVVGIVVGSLFLILLVTNIALGILLCTNTRAKYKRPRRIPDDNGNSAQEEKPLPLGTLRMVYKRLSRAERAPGDDVSANGANSFEGRFHDAASGSHGTVESDDITDDGWRAIEEADSLYRLRYYKQSHLYKQKWEAVLSGQSIDTTTSQKGLPYGNLDAKLVEHRTETTNISDDQLPSKGWGKDSERPVTCDTFSRDSVSTFEPITEIYDHHDICRDRTEGIKTTISSSEDKNIDNNWFPISLGMDELKEVDFSKHSLRSPVNKIPEDKLLQNIRSSGWVPQFTSLKGKRSSLSDTKTHSSIKTSQSLSTDNVDVPVRPTAVNTKLGDTLSTDNDHQKYINIPDCKTGGKKTNGREDIETLNLTQRIAADRDLPKHKSKNSKNEWESPRKRGGKLFVKKQEQARREYKERTTSSSDTERVSWGEKSPTRSPHSSSFLDDTISTEMGDDCATEGLHKELMGGDMMPVSVKASSDANVFQALTRTENELVQNDSDVKHRNNTNHLRLNVIDGNNVIESNGENDLKYKRSPTTYGLPTRFNILGWSISDDDKQSYFNCNSISTNVHLQDYSTRMEVHHTKEAETYQNTKRPHSVTQSISDRSQAKGFQQKPVLGLPSIYEDPYPQDVSGTERNKVANPVRGPDRRRSFVHRLLNPPKRNKSSQILKTFHSEDFAHLKIDGLEIKPQQEQRQSEGRSFRGQQANTSTRSKSHKAFKQRADNEHFPSFQFLVAQSQWKRAYTKHYTDLKSLPYFVPHFTLSEEDLDMYHDYSIPTIDDLVQNGTIKRLGSRRENKTFYPNYAIEMQYSVPNNALETKASLSFATIQGRHRVKDVLSHDSSGEVQITQLSCQNQSNKVPPSSKEKGGRFRSHDSDVLGFHTGVSDKYHSINGRKESFGYIFLQENKLGHNRDDKSKEGNLLLIPDAIQMQTRESEVDEIDGGNWNINVLSPRSQSSRDVDSVSSFALSDFDMGESDVDEMSKGGCDDNDDKDKDCGLDCSMNDMNRAIQDVRL